MEVICEAVAPHPVGNINGTVILLTKESRKDFEKYIEHHSKSYINRWVGLAQLSTAYFIDQVIFRQSNVKDFKPSRMNFHDAFKKYQVRIIVHFKQILSFLIF